MNVENCSSYHNYAGVVADSTQGGTTTVRASNSMVTDNKYGFVNYGTTTTFYSRGNNTVANNNGGDTVGTIKFLGAI